MTLRVTNKLYVDGCSYARGHTADHKWWPSALRDHYNCILLDQSEVARSNDCMLSSFLAHYDSLLEGDAVIIFWSHSERQCIGYGDTYQKHLYFKNHDDKEHSGIGWELARHKGINNINYRASNSNVVRTASYAYTVQRLCEVKGIRLVQLMTNPYSEIQTSLNDVAVDAWASLLKIWNWPVHCFTDLERLFQSEGEDVDDFRIYNAYWALSSLPLVLARSYGELNNKEYVDEDYKHFNKDFVEDVFVNLMIDAIEEGKTLADYDTPSKWYTEIFHTLMNVQFDRDAYHHERNYNELRDIILSTDLKRSAEFIYEE